MTLDLDPAGIVVSIIIGMVGFAAFLHGKRQQRVAPLVAGLALMIFPYFVSSILLTVVISVALLGLMFALGRFGL